MSDTFQGVLQRVCVRGLNTGPWMIRSPAWSRLLGLEMVLIYFTSTFQTVEAGLSHRRIHHELCEGSAQIFRGRVFGGPVAVIAAETPRRSQWLCAICGRDKVRKGAHICILARCPIG